MPGNNVKKSGIKRKSPVTKESVWQILGLEKKVEARNFKIKDMEDLISIYSSYVENYEMLSDPISMYFMEKIQALVCNQDTIRALSNLEDKKKQKGKNLQVEELEEIVERRDTIQEMRQMVKDDLTNSRFDFDEKTIEKRHSINTAKRIRAQEQNFNMKFQDHIDGKDKKEYVTQKGAFNKLENKRIEVIKSHREISTQNDSLIKKNLSSQDEKLQAKLRERQQASINKSMSKYKNNLSSISQSSKIKSTSSMDGDMLNDLNNTSDFYAMRDPNQKSPDVKAHIQNSNSNRQEATSDFSIVIKSDNFEDCKNAVIFDSAKK